MKLSIITFVTLLSCTSAFAPSAVSPRSAVKALNVKTGSAGAPMGSSGRAKSKEEDLELTTQVILDYVNSQASQEGIVDDDDEE